MATRHISRVTNGQRAAVCGLVIAGVSFTDACKIVDVSRPRLKAVLPVGWTKYVRSGKTRSWKGEVLEQIRLAYLDQSQTGKDIARRFNIDVSYVYQLARVHGWRRRNRAIYVKRAFDTEQQRLLFNKLVRHGIPTFEAYAEACR